MILVKRQQQQQQQQSQDSKCSNNNTTTNNVQIDSISTSCNSKCSNNGSSSNIGIAVWVQSLSTVESFSLSFEKGYVGLHFELAIYIYAS